MLGEDVLALAGLGLRVDVAVLRDISADISLVDRLRPLREIFV
jgi:hypothetical protein